MRAWAWALLVVLLAAPPARAAETDAERAARWTELRQAVFRDRPVLPGEGVIELEAPTRAQDAALVPITVTLPGTERVKAVYILVDGNPSPLAGIFRFGPAADPRALKTRVRVDQYTLVHAVAETEDGRLFAAERFVKAAGGCSAPSLKDPQVAMSRMGQMRLRLDGDAGVREGQPATAHLLVSHPNNNGMQMDQVSRHFIPARYIQDIRVSHGDALVFAFEADISLSEDPAITFGFTPRGPGPLAVEVQDSARAVWRQSFDLNARGS